MISGFALFCDDIREEVTQKLALIGMYRGSMVLQSDFPAVIPGLAIYASVIAPVSDLPFKGELQVFSTDDRKVPIRTLDVDVPEIAEEYLRITESAEPGHELRRHVPYIIKIAPLELRTPGFIRVRLAYKDAVLRLGDLRVRPNGAPSTPAASPA